MFIEVKRSHTAPCVTPSGPCNVLDSVSRDGFSQSRDFNVVFKSTYVADGMEIRVTGAEGADNSMLFKASLLEEVLKRGFKPLSNVTDDLLVLSREVDVY